MSQILAEVIALQGHYTSENTEQMQDRGIRIRDVLPAALRTRAHQLPQLLDIPANDLLIEGKDGAGRKSEVPWVRLASRSRSPSATAGWYVVWLFRKDAAGVYLALAHGSTQFQHGSFVSRSNEELKTLMGWARKRLSAEIATNPRLVQDVNLAAPGYRSLGDAYEKSCVAAFYYPASQLPNDDILFQDLFTLAKMLSALYRTEAKGEVPTTDSLEVFQAEIAAAAISRPSSAATQGYGLSHPERLAVERRAMELATNHLSSQGYTVSDVSAKESYDLLAKRGLEILHIEVKGTTGGLGSILLTANEVELHKQRHPKNGLVVIHSMSVATQNGLPTAHGGQLEAWMPWRIDSERLRALTYAYTLSG
ncbi:DUF3578 domain-containing protein [Pseudoxanthomonas sp. PXM04]|uniref:MrcB family domain-containing protein n=1 Tax=Pseudoxanthomonas sp. PXM04 TaxID=2769297 RepID=UPI0017827A35|nr:DUF3578 domain-containing protein [Pseudoxanthomonas sp. PXM04]MBD9379156.1 DUF3578 domain-containing protein [Pseudoxanthomonas sp. PXM04]